MTIFMTSFWIYFLRYRCLQITRSRVNTRADFHI